MLLFFGETRLGGADNFFLFGALAFFALALALFVEGFTIELLEASEEEAEEPPEFGT